MNKRIVFSLTLTTCLMLLGICHGEQTLIAKKVAHAPIIDGIVEDYVWKEAAAAATHDRVAGVPIALKAVYTDNRIFFLVIFPDPDESRLHKAWIWDRKSGSYKIGPLREDCFVLKWNMASDPTDLSVFADAPYLADIWFWKACRTDPLGFADDKIQKLSVEKLPKSMKLTSKSGKTTYLKRKGDRGKPAYRNTLYIEYKGDITPHFINQFPRGSRADIRAKGIWANGEWTIEFGRKLNTGHKDDVQFEIGKLYPFGVSRYEIAGRKPDPSLSQPLFGSGDVSEPLFLKLEP